MTKPETTNKRILKFLNYIADNGFLSNSNIGIVIREPNKSSIFRIVHRVMSQNLVRQHMIIVSNTKCKRFKKERKCFTLTKEGWIYLQSNAVNDND